MPQSPAPSAPVDIPPGRRFGSVLDDIRPEVMLLPRSGIEEVFSYGLGRQGLIPLWVGEGDLPTPDFICDAAVRALAAGETFYTHQGGIPDLRAAIAHYMTGLYGRPFAGDATPFGPERFFVTVGGMQALQFAVRMVAGHGDDVLIPTPAWPNFGGALMAAGARPVEVPMRFAAAGDDGRWHLAVEDLAQAVTERTRAIVINSPSNPTGWTATHDDLEAILDFARARNLWIVADEIYGRFVYEGRLAPSFHHIMRADDRVLFVQTLSKELGHDGLAGRLARSAAGARQPDREPGAILDVRRTGPDTTCRGGGAHGWRSVHRSPGGSGACEPGPVVGGTAPDRARPSVETRRRLLPVLPHRRRVG